MTEDVIASPPPSGPRSDRTRIALAALGGGLSVLLIGAGAVAVSGMASADQSPSPAPSGAPSDAPSGAPSGGPGGPGMRGGSGPLGAMMGGGLFGGFGMAEQLGDALHGSAVVKNEDGDFVTYEAQRGSVTAVSSTSISVKSEDGYEHTYVVTKDTVVNRDGTIEDISTGDDVLVVATADAGTSTATRIVDLAELKKRLEDMKDKWQQGNGQGPPMSGPWHRGDKSGAPRAPGNGSGSATPSPSESSPTEPAPDSTT